MLWVSTAATCATFTTIKGDEPAPPPQYTAPSQYNAPPQSTAPSHPHPSTPSFNVILALSVAPFVPGMRTHCPRPRAAACWDTPHRPRRIPLSHQWAIRRRRHPCHRRHRHRLNHPPRLDPGHLQQRRRRRRRARIAANLYMPTTTAATTFLGPPARSTNPDESEGMHY